MISLPGDIRLHAPGSIVEWILFLTALAVSYVLFRRVADRRFALLAGPVLGFFGFVFVGDSAIPIALAVVAGAACLANRRDPRPEVDGRTFTRQALIIAAGFVAYEVARILTEGAEATALANARDVIGFEKALGLYFEPDLQSLIIDHEAWVRFFNRTYSFLFLPVVLATLVWMFMRDGPNFFLYRNALGISTVLTVLTSALWPVAPPRLVPESELVDSVVLLGREHHFANEFAAVPSLHVGWMALTGYILARSIGGRRGLAIGVLPGGLMSIIVIVTGNHYWVDGVIGAAYAVVPAVIMAHWRGTVALSRRTAYVLANTPRLQVSLLLMGGLETYLVVAEVVSPGFTDFWGYLVFQMAGIMVLLVIGEVVLVNRGGLSWQTHLIATVCSYFDVFGTDGNLYARIDEYDKLTHFLGVAAITSAAYDVLRGFYGRGARRWVAEDRLIAAVTIGIAIGVAWEVYELLGDKVFHTTRAMGMRDTANDIFSDSLGAIAAGMWLWWSERRAATKTAPEQAPERVGPGGAAP